MQYSSGQKQPHQNQAHRSPKRIFDNFKATIDEFPWNAHHGLGTEPSSEASRDDHDQRQTVPGYRKVRSILIFDPAQAPIANVPSR